MNIFVCVKQVPDTETKIVPTGDGSFIETSSIKWIMNPYDEFAVEQALLIKNQILQLTLLSCAWVQLKIQKRFVQLWRWVRTMPYLSKLQTTLIPMR